jgi:type II secretory pathway component PulC
MASADAFLRQLDRRRRGVARANRFFLVLLPLVILILGVEAAHWVSAERSVSTAPVVPELGFLQKAPAAIPELHFSEGLFPAKRKQPAKSSSPAGPAQVAVQEVQWKLLGVAMTPVKRAYLENSETKQTLSVGEGERMGDLLIKKIEERSVLLEREGKEYEIRL